MTIQVIILVGLAILFFYVNKFISSKEKLETRTAKIVKCKKCDLNLVESEALKENGEWYCSREHLPTN